MGFHCGWHINHNCFTYEYKNHKGSLYFKIASTCIDGCAITREASMSQGWQHLESSDSVAKYTLAMRYYLANNYDNTIKPTQITNSTLLSSFRPLHSRQESDLLWLQMDGLPLRHCERSFSEIVLTAYPGWSCYAS